MAGIAEETSHEPPITSGSPLFAAAGSPVEPAEQSVLDRIVADLAAARASWAGLPISERIRILDEVQAGLQRVAERWVAASLEAKGMPPGGFAESEEWAMFAGAGHMVRLHRQVLQNLDRLGRPRLPRPAAMNAHGQVVASLFPKTRQESMLFMGMHGEVWLEPGVGLDEAVETPPWLAAGHSAQVVLVLGAGNASMLPVSDVLSKLFGEGHVVLLKMNPVNAYLGPLYEEAFAPLIRPGFLRIAYGGAATGAYLCHHPQVDAVHLTGSDKTYDAIVFGTGAEGAARKAAHQPLLDKPVTAELGGVNPVIVVPGPWTDRELNQKAGQLASFLYSNASFNCLTPRVIIQQKDWPQRDALIEAVGKTLQQAGTRPAYYPGAEARHAAFLAAHPEARRFGQAGPGELPWTIACDLDPRQTDDPAFRSESFCSMYAETALAAGSAADFLRQAVDFANDVLWGTLTATILVHPSSLKDPATTAALEDAIARLRFGTITVNAYPALTYVLTLMPWGAYPGHEPWDIQSGAGKVNNFYHLRRPQKAILRAPFGGPQAGGLSSPNAAPFGRKLAGYLSQPSLAALVQLTSAALRG